MKCLCRTVLGLAALGVIATGTVAVLSLSALASADTSAPPRAAGPAKDTTGTEPPADPSPRFPELKGQSLTEVDYRLPAGLPGRVRVVIMAFERDQQELVDTWIPALVALEEEAPGFRFFEIPTISSSYRVIRGWIDGGMRSGIPDEEARARTITVYTDVSDVADALRLPTRETIYTMLLDDEGRVVWQVSGPRTDAALEELKAAVRARLIREDNPE